MTAVIIVGLIALVVFASVIGLALARQRRQNTTE